MANEEQLAILKQGPDVWNKWREEHPDEHIDLAVADLPGVSLAWYNLSKANLSGMNLNKGSLFKADLRGARLGEGYFIKVDLRGVDLRNAIFDTETDLSGVQIDEETSLGDIRWNGVDLTGINWEPVYRFASTGEEIFPELGIRAYRQLSAQLRAQGLNEYADRFSYRAQVLRRKFLWKRKMFGAAAWYIFLDLLAGYGYRPQRSFIFYLCVIAVFAASFLTISSLTHAGLSPLGAFVLSMTSFNTHGILRSFAW